MGRPPSVPSSRLAHLRHGIILGECFAQVRDPKEYTKEHLQNWNTSSDIALIKSSGFDHVRLSVNPEPIIGLSPSGRHHRIFRLSRRCREMILDAGLAVEIDMHPDSDFKARPKEDDFVERFADF